ncbi:hypothetical protein [Spirosoma koreense]
MLEAFMRKYFCCLVKLFCLSNPCFSQIDQIKDSFFEEVCNTLLDNQHRPDKFRIDEINKQHIIPLLKKYSKYEKEDVYYFITARLQRVCPEYQHILQRKYGSKDDMILIEKKPVGILDKPACEAFLKIGNYFYYDDKGDTVQLAIQDGYWVDKFKDDTYSKLKFYWIGDCEFEIEFIESNNRLRKNYNRPGDKYRYQILTKEKNYYILSVTIPGIDEYHTFKVYY